MKDSTRHLTRRGFLGRSGLGLTGALMGSGAAAFILSGCAREEHLPSPDVSVAPTDYGPFRVAFQSYSLRHFQELDDFVREARKLDLDYVELWRGHLRTTASPEEIQNVANRLAEVGIEPIAFGVERFTADHEANEALFRFGQALGVENLSANPDKDAATFDSLEKLVQQYDIRIAIHNHGPEDERWQRPEWILETVQDRDPRIGACADLGHFIRAGVDAVEAIQTLGSRVLGVHFKDFDEEGNDVVVGRGRLNVQEAMAALRRVGFDGPLSLEYEGDRENPVPAMLECLEVMREAGARLEEMRVFLPRYRS